MNETKPFEIDKRLIYEAYKKVKSNKGGSGIDGITIEEYDKDLSNHLYRLWFVKFSPAISRKASMKLRESIRSWNLTSKVYMNIKSLASLLNPQIQGWINYYAKFNKTEFRKVMAYLNEKLARWLRRKYKKLRNGYVAKAIYALSLTARKNPTLFAHWAHGYTLYAKRSNYQ